MLKMVIKLNDSFMIRQKYRYKLKEEKKEIEIVLYCNFYIIGISICIIIASFDKD